jgi:ERCC4-type nuclease
MDIIVDTREQLPLFKNKCIKYQLVAGDYSTLKLRHSFAIERKSLADLYSTILQGHIRFRQEHIRAMIHKINLVLFVEGSKKDFAAKNWPGGENRECSGQTLIKIIESIEYRWPLEIVWAKSRNVCKNKIVERLEIEELKLQQNEKRKIGKNAKSYSALKRKQVRAR